MSASKHVWGECNCNYDIYLIKYIFYGRASSKLVFESFVLFVLYLNNYILPV